MRAWRQFWPAWSGLLLALLAGCAGSRLPPVDDIPRQAELATVPFFPDDSHFCGPAALATSLTATGLAVQPAQLVDQVFLPGRGGSLQLEMLAGARRNGGVAVPIPGRLDALLREIAAGHPVVVLQNLGLDWAPAWHYAVAVGYDLEAGQLLLRSGLQRRQELSLRTFDNTWARSQRWAFVALPPGRLPATADETDATRALVAFERNAPPAAAVLAYRSGLARWPGNATLAMGLGNALHAAGDRPGAAAAFARVGAEHDLPAAHNNHARVLLELGQLAEARRAAERGLLNPGPWQAALQETLAAIEAAAQR